MGTIGIDLGTTNSCVAVLEAGEANIVVNQEGSRTTPSVVAFTDHERLVGVVAKRQAVTNPSKTLYSIKRLMGKSFSESIAVHDAPYEIVEGENNTAKIDVGELYSPEEISAMILSKLKQDAEDYLGHEVDSAVITVPAYWGDSERQATKTAGAIAGLNVLRIINEPTAAALAYGLQDQEQTIMVFDLGGGTLDVSILEIGDGVYEVLTTSGDNELGGDDFDVAVFNWIVDEFEKLEGIDLSEDPMANQRVFEAAEKAKVELSNMQETRIHLPFVSANQEGAKHLDLLLTRSHFYELTNHLIERIALPISKALDDARMEASQLDQIILVGGMTRVPLIGEKIFELTGITPSRTVNPDEAVAKGAAIQAGILEGSLEDVLLLDVTPLTLGVETRGDIMFELIERNTTIPTKKTETFSTAEENQKSVEIHVLQGERIKASENKSLGRFQLSNIAPAPAGKPQIEVAFEIDANGMLNVSAKDVDSGQSRDVVVSASGGLGKIEIERMVQEAKTYREQDRIFKALAEQRHSARELVRSTKDNINFYEGQDLNDVIDGVERLEEVITRDDVFLIKERQSELESVVHAISARTYRDVIDVQSEEV